MVRVRRYVLGGLFCIGLILMSCTYIYISDRFEEKIQSGHSYVRSTRLYYPVAFPGHSENCKLDIDLVIESSPVDMIVTLYYDDLWEPERSEAPNWTVFLEALNVTEVNETLYLFLHDCGKIHILIRTVDSTVDITMHGHIIASCKYLRHPVPLALRNILWGFTGVILVILAIDVIGTWLWQVSSLVVTRLSARVLLCFTIPLAFFISLS